MKALKAIPLLVRLSPTTGSATRLATCDSGPQSGWQCQ